MRPIDADKFKAYMQDKYLLFDHTLADIDAQPTMDAVEVVRCKDCKLRGEPGCFRNRDSYTWYNRPNDDDFCSWGERKDDDKH